LKTKGASLAPKASFEIHTAVIADILMLLKHLGDTAGLTTDSQLEAFYLGRVITTEIPAMTESLGQVRATGSAVLTGKSLTPEDRMRYALLAGTARMMLSSLQRDFRTAFDASAALQAPLGPVLAEAVTKSVEFLDIDEREVVNTTTWSLAATEFFATGTSVITAQVALRDASSLALEGLLTACLIRLNLKLALVAALVALVLATVVYLFVAFYRAVMQMIAALEAAAHGDLSQALRLDNRDELGRACVGMAASLQEVMGQIVRNAQTLSITAEELNAVSRQMSSNAEETANQTGVVSATADEVSTNVQTVAAGSEEMTVSIREIATHASEAAGIAQSAVRVAASTTAIISDLRTSGEQIGQVMKFITSIAEQTNLLALNATIEAARAGDAGRGFAVVASAVKQLAKETARATEDVGRKVSAIQAHTKSAVEAIGTISEIVGRISDLQNAIASAVEEQATTTQEIGRGVGEAAKGAIDIAHGITTVAKAAAETSGGVSNSQDLAANLARMAVELQTLVDQFKLAESHRARSTPARATILRRAPSDMRELV
jgi:methyl-accepting chemotaxis protein